MVTVFVRWIPGFCAGFPVRFILWYYATLTGCHFTAQFSFSSGFSACFRPHFPNYHKYHLYSSIKKVIFRPIFTNKNAIFTFRIFSKKSDWRIDVFYIVHIKCIHLRQTCLTPNPNPQKIAPIQNLPNTSKIVEQPHA